MSYRVGKDNDRLPFLILPLHTDNERSFFKLYGVSFQNHDLINEFQIRNTLNLLYFFAVELAR